MKKKTALLGAAAFIVGAVILSPSLVSAYQGDPGVQGPNYTAERHEAMTQAFNNGDYNAWKGQMEGKGAASRVTEANFPRFAEAHKLASEGDLEGARKIREELGLGMKDGSGQKQGSGEHKADGSGQNGMGRNK